jgi:phospholipid/cholesterol/gamma-HCH transport system substrate-binding protein
MRSAAWGQGGPMDRDRRLSLTVGAFALASLLLLAVAILSLSSQEGIWTPRYRLVGYYDNVGGLISGAAVGVAGTRVGRVESVGFAARPDGSPAVRVVLQIDREVQERIRDDSVAGIATVGLLGDQMVEISMGTEDARPLADGEEIRTLSPFDLNVMVTRGSQALESVSSLARNLDAVVASFRGGLGERQVATTFDSVADIVREVHDGEGLLHRLVYERYEGDAVRDLEGSLASLDGILREVEQGDGVLHSLIYDDPREQHVVREALEAGARLNSILGKIDRGEGTLGLMLNDPTLYEEVKLLVGGANRSTLVRSLVKLVTPDPNE